MYTMMTRLTQLLSFVLILPCHLLVSSTPEESFIAVEDSTTLQVLTPTLADRKTSKIKLKNGLEAYLVSDPHLDQSGAALSVRAGSWMDPDAFPGLAHFLEHMLFLGTKKYPDESSFDAFISVHGGMANAFTSNDYTSFMYSIDNAAFTESLDRFASFFREPLFNPSGVSRELNAIDQEYAKNVENDDFRFDSILKELGNRLHPNSRFSMGNSETLRHVSRETFIDWYQQHYSANLMRLTVFSNLPMEQLQGIVIQEFQDIANVNLTPASIDHTLVSNETLNKIIYVVPFKNVQKLVLIWDLPLELFDVKEDQASSLVCQILGHEGGNSLLEALKKENLAETLGCGEVGVGGRNQEVYLEIGLTKHGVKEVYKVIQMVFQVIAQLKANGIPVYLFDELQQLARINYQYQTSDRVFNTMMKHASQMMGADFAGYPEKNSIPQKYNAQAIAAVLDAMSIDNAIIALMASPTLTSVQPNRKEKWLGVQYALKPIPEEALASWRTPGNNVNFQLPEKNPFIPEHLTLPAILTADQTSTGLIPKPIKIIQNERGEIYYCPDTHFGLPQVSLQLTIKTPQVDVGVPSKIVMADLYTALLQEALNPLSYPATLAGLSYEISRENFGISINIQGYSEKADLLVDKIISQIKKPSFAEDQFKAYKELLFRQYQNEALASPLKQARELLKSVLYKKYSSPKALTNAIKKVSYESFIDYSKQIFSKAYVEGIFYGNLTDKQAHEYANGYISALNFQPYPKKNHKIQEVLVFPANKGPFYLEAASKVQGNGIVLAISNGPYSFKDRAAQQILMEAMSEPFYTSLRTQQQTGYIVDSGATEIEKQLFCVFMSQSSSHDPRDLLARFELFIENFLKSAEESISKESFTSIKNALVAKLEKPAKNMNEMSKLLNQIAFTYAGDFDWLQKRIDGFNQLTYEAFMPMMQEMLGKGNRGQLAILVKGTPTDRTFNFIRLKNLMELRKLSRYAPGWNK